MSWLHLWALAASAMIAVPIILHFRRRETSRRISFPALRYLSRAEDERMRSLRASDLLLLLLRVGLIVALAAAAAGPLVGSGGARDHEPSDVAIVIDNSASTARLAGDRPLLDELIERARESLDEAGSRDRFWILPTVGAPLAAGASSQRALAALDRVAQTDGHAALADAVGDAEAGLPVEEDRAREIQLLSDLQASAWRETAAQAGGAATVVVYRPAEPEGWNGAVGSLDLTGGPFAPSGAAQTALVGLTRFPAAEDSAAVQVRLELGGRTAGAARSRWGATAGIRLPELPAGRHAGRAESDPSGLRTDDVRFFTAAVIEPPRVRHYGDPDGFLYLALSTMRNAGRLADGDAVALVETPPPSLEAASRSLVLVPPGDPVELPRFNQLLASLGTSWSAATDPAAGRLRFAADGGIPGLASVTVRQRYLLRGGVPDTVFLRTEDGEAWAVGDRSGDLRLVLLASPLTPEATDLPASPAMIPFVEALTLHWSSVGGWPPGDFEAGAAVLLPAWADSVRPPEGVATSVEGGASFTPMRAGIYELFGQPEPGSVRQTPAGGDPIPFAVNVPLSESDLTPLEPSAVQEQLRGRDVIIAGPSDREWRRAMFQSRRGLDAAPWLLAAALLLALGEVALATPGHAEKSRRESLTR